MKRTYVYEQNEHGEKVLVEKKSSRVKYTNSDVERDGRQVFDTLGMSGREMLSESVKLTQDMDSRSYTKFHNKLYANRRDLTD